MFKGQSQQDSGLGCPVVFLFSGQGSQYYHMARTLYYQHEGFRRTMERLDRRVKHHAGESMLSVLYDTQRNKGEPFHRVRFTHPANFCVQYALADLLRQAGWCPDYVLGMSIGEFVAAAFSGAMEPDLALDAVLNQALTLERHCPQGGMLAILAPVGIFNKHPEIFYASELAGINYEEHFVIAGDSSVLESIQASLSERGLSSQLLPVDYGFHSALIDPASQSNLNYLKGIQLKKPLIPVVSCRTGREVISYSSDHFWRATREPMRFTAALQWLETRWSKGRGVIYIDLGPGGTLANFIKRGLNKESASTFQSVITPFDQELERLHEVEQSLLHNLGLRNE